MRRTSSAGSKAAPRRWWPVAAIAVTVLSLLLVFAPTAEAGQEPVTLKDGLAQSQIFNDDLEVEPGQVLEGDVVVYSGDVEIKRNGRIAGTLTVYSGDIEIDEGGRVDGNITSWSGDIQVNGQVGGSISAMAGDVEVGNTGLVGGDISVLSGDIKQRAGADVGGSVLRGPDLKLPASGAQLLPWLDAPQSPEEANLVAQRERENGFLGFAGRVLTALLLLALLVGGAAAVAALRPAWTAEVHGVLNRQPALAFAAGLIANVLLLAVIGFLFLTVCLSPPALLLSLGLLVFNAAGLAAVGSEIGGRASERLGGQWALPGRVALGVLLPGVVVAFLWSLGGCFGFFGGAGALLLGSFGVGSILVKVLNLGASPAPSAAPSSAPSPAPADPAPAGSSSTAAAPADAAAAPAGSASAPAAETSSPAVATAESAPAEGTAATEAPAPAAPTPAWWQDAAAADEPLPPVAVEPAAPLAVVAQPGEQLPMVQDDFTQIEGIGPKLSQRLHAANIRTYADLADLPPETLAGILGWTGERVLRSGVIERAHQLAQGA